MRIGSVTWNDSSLWGGESKAANASLTLQLFPSPACADLTQKHSSREAGFSLFSFLPLFRSGGWMLVLGHGKEIPTCASRSFSAVVGHVTISSVPVTSCRCHLSLDAELTTLPQQPASFAGIARSCDVGLTRRWQSCSSPSLELLWLGAFVRWHLVSIRTSAPAELFPFQQLLWLWLLVVLCFLRSHHLLHWQVSNVRPKLLQWALWQNHSPSVSAKGSFGDEGGTGCP